GPAPRRAASAELFGLGNQLKSLRGRRQALLVMNLSPDADPSLARAEDAYRALHPAWFALEGSRAVRFGLLGAARALVRGAGRSERLVLGPSFDPALEELRLSFALAQVQQQLGAAWATPGGARPDELARALIA